MILGYWRKLFPSRKERDFYLFGEDEEKREGAFNQLNEEVERKGKLFRYILKNSKNKEEAEDIRNEVFAEYWEELLIPSKREKLKSQPIEAVLMQKAKNILSHKHGNVEKREKQQKSKKEYGEYVYQNEILHNTAEEALESLQGIFGVSDLLEDSEKVALLLAFFKDKKADSCYEIFKFRVAAENYTFKDIAIFLGITEGNVKTKFYDRCLKKARKYLESLGIIND